MKIFRQIMFFKNRNNEIVFSIACIVISFFYYSCHADKNTNSDDFKKTNDNRRIELKWSAFVEKCYGECIRKNRSGKFYKNEKLYNCDKYYLNEYGNGIMRPDITPYDICPDTQKLWDIDND